jgi:hypothetical protein
MSEHEEAVKQFKKMLQLAWQEGNQEMELKAYDLVSVDYYYLGDLEKSKYYHDRYIRGKSENDHSIMKKVTCNLLNSRREQRQNQRDLQFTAGLKIKSEMQRLPSPSNHSKGTQQARAINLLPHYTEANAQGNFDTQESENQ